MSPAVCPLPPERKAQFVSFVMQGEVVVEGDVRKLQRDIPHLFLKRPRLADHLLGPGFFFGCFGLSKTPVQILERAACALNGRFEPCRSGLRQYAARFCAGDHADGGRDFPISGKSLCVIAVHMRGYDVANRLLCNLASNLRDQGKHSRRRGVSVDNQQVFFIFEDRGVAVNERPAARHRGIDTVGLLLDVEQSGQRLFRLGARPCRDERGALQKRCARPCGAQHSGEKPAARVRVHVPSVLIPAKCQHKILGCYITGIPVAVQIVRRHKSTRAGAQARGLPVDGHFHLAFPNEKQLFVRMPVRRMRRHAGRKFRIRADPDGGRNACLPPGSGTS